MKFDFDNVPSRRGSGSYKWDSAGEGDIIPLWVADMDFPTAPAVREALARRMESGIFGYVKVPESYYFALRRWFRLRHGWSILREQVIYTSGVVPAISAIIKALVKPGEGVIIQTPAYNCFFSSVRNNGGKILENPLIREETAEGFTYRIDFEGLEELATGDDARMLLLCNPHNPTGRVWTREELEKVAEICHRHNVAVVSDEIHCELMHPGYEYVPYLTVDAQGVACCSPSKAFNIAGLQIANIVVRDAGRRALIDKAININEVCDVNPFGVVALQAAYDDGEEWLEALNAYLHANYGFLRREIATKMPQLRVCDSESTYLAWIDVSALGMSDDELEEIAREEGRVWVNSGTMYAGKGYIRINYACPRALLAEGLERLRRVVEKYHR